VNGRSAAATTAQTLEANSKDITAQIEASESTTKAQIEASESTTKAQLEFALATVTLQIEADRQHRIWEKRAATYVEAVKQLRHQQEIRYTSALPHGPQRNSRREGR
jgi:isopropylmalate/homocitrate/citramalate synthase